MTRIQFETLTTKDFLDKIIAQTQSPSLRALLQFGISTNYTSLKNYYTNRRLLPEDLFLELCKIGNLENSDLSYKKLDESWGKKKGGKVSKKGSSQKSKNLKAQK